MQAIWSSELGMAVCKGSMIRKGAATFVVMVCVLSGCDLLTVFGMLCVLFFPQ